MDINSLTKEQLLERKHLLERKVELESQRPQESSVNVNFEKGAPLPLIDDIALGFAGTQEDKKSILQKRYKYVHPMPDGNFLLGDDTNNLMPLSPDGLFNDAVGKLARHVGDIPAIATTSLALAAAPETLGGSMIFAGGGMAGGEVLRQLIGKGAGVNTASATQVGEDALISGLFGAGTEGLFRGFSGTTKAMLGKMGQTFKAVETSQATDIPIFTKGMAKVFSTITGKPEVGEAIQMSSRHGNINILKGSEYLNPEKAIGLSDQLIGGLIKTRKALGGAVGEADEALASATKAGKKYPIDLLTPGRAFQEALTDREIIMPMNVEATQGMLFGMPNPSSLAEPADKAGLNRIMSKLTRLSVDAREKGGLISARNAIELRRGIDDIFDRLTPDGQHIAQGLRDSLSDQLMKLANDLKMPEYAQAYANFKEFMGARRILGQAGYNTYNPVSMGKLSQDYIGLRDNPFAQKATQTIGAYLKQHAGNDIVPELEKFSSAQTLANIHSSLFRLSFIIGLGGFASGLSRLARFGALGIASTPEIMVKILQLSGRGDEGAIKEGVQSLLGVGERTAGVRAVGRKVLPALIATEAKKKAVKEPEYAK